MYSIKQALFLVIPALLILQACGTSDEVLVVRETPRSGISDTTQAAGSDEFIQINIGLIEPVTNFDPLFADNLSTMRVISLIYQSLFTLNEEGDPEPLLAERFEISRDSLEYVISLRENVYFHNSEVFTAGIGRRMLARDVIRAFERTALSNVPPTAAGLLMNIQGYRSYFTEQRELYDPAKRILDSITGIEAPDSRTLVITLREKDPDLLRKLASPMLSIYAPEAVENRSGSLSQNPVGTGPFSFRSIEENRIILVASDTDNGASNRINRVDFVFSDSESRLFQEFARGRIDWIPELGPQMMSQLITDGRLAESYSDQYNLVSLPSKRITSLYLNSASDADIHALSEHLVQFSEYHFPGESKIDFNSQGLHRDPDTERVTTGISGDDYYIVNTDNPFARSLYSEINREWMSPDAGLAYLNIRVTVPEAAFYSKSTDTFHEPYFTNNDNRAWLKIESGIYGIYQNRMSGIEPMYGPWQLSLDAVQLNN